MKRGSVAIKYRRMKKDFYLTRYALIIKRLESSPATYSQLEDYLLSSFEFQDAGILLQKHKLIP